MLAVPPAVRLAAVVRAPEKAALSAVKLETSPLNVAALGSVIDDANRDANGFAEVPRELVPVVVMFPATARDGALMGPANVRAPDLSATTSCWSCYMHCRPFL